MRLQTMTVEGDPAREICRLAKRLEVDLVVMPTHGHGPFRRFLLGSVTGKVLHDCACPVWTGAHLEQAAGPIGFRTVTCAVDLGDQTDAVLQWTAGMASAWDAGVSVIHVVHEDGGAEPDKLDAATDEVEKRRAAIGVEAETQVVSGTAIPATVCSTAKRLGADLLVIGRGHEPGAASRLRNMAYGIVRESQCPVVSV
jgi:nucleotide-binding universal stress UspA family protein